MKKLLAVVAILIQISLSSQVTQDSVSVNQSVQTEKPDAENSSSPENESSTIDESSFKIKEIRITGTSKYSKNQIMRYTGLYEGDYVDIPGMQLNSAVKKLWDSKLFSDVEIFLSKVEGKDVYLRINLKALPELGSVKFEGASKSKNEKLIKENGLKSKTKITDDLRTKLQNSIRNQYTEKGFPDAHAVIKEKVNPADSSSINWTIAIEKGPRVKVKSIQITGNKELSASKIRARSFKNTKQKKIYRFWKKSKYVPEKYEEDLVKVVETLQSYGFRDAKITSDTVIRTDEKNYDIKLNVAEGKRYYLGNITFSGNSAYSSEILTKVVGYKKGEPYDAVGINKKISGSEKNDDIATLYYNNGYVFSSVVPIEKAVRNDTIDVEVKIREGEQAYWDKVTFSGNTRTHDHVIQRSLRTVPGKLFSKEDIQRTIMDLAQMGYFEAQGLRPDITPNAETKTVDVNYKLEEKGSNSQVELQGGYGGNRFIGTLGLTFGNFSFNDFFKKKAWKPIPMGDGQSVSLRAQAGSNYQNYSVSFTEPWITGKRPTSLTVSLYSTILNYDRYYTTTGRNKLNIYGAQVGLTTRLNWPDDYFRLSYGINYQLYSFKNYPFSIVNESGAKDWTDGESNNFSVYANIGRYSAGLDPIFPTMGSEFELSLKLTPPYSALNNEDYSKKTDREKYKWLEYYKIKMKAYWYKELVGKFVLKAGGEFGFLSSYNNNIGTPPFERFYLGGTGLYGNRFDGREIIPLRGYKDSSSFGGQTNDITPLGGGTSYARFMMELRYPVLMGGATKIYALGFVEAGNTWSNNKSFNPFELKRSAGFGVRIFMPQFGMLGFDFAKGFDKTINSTSANGWETHFIFGQQF